MNTKIAFHQKTRKLSNREYRLLYDRERRPKYYMPSVHLGFNLGLLLTVLVGCLYFISEWSFLFVAVAVGVFLFGNVAVYFIHRYPLHKRLKIWSFPFDSHTVEHHRYFTSENITYRNALDFYAIFFPSFVVAFYVALISPLFYLTSSYILGRDGALFFTGASAGYFLLYEFFHWASHLPKDHFLMKSSWISMMREHHRIHHNQKLMHKYNFTIVYPLMDIIMGTRFKGVLPEDLASDHNQNLLENLNSKELEELNRFDVKGQHAVVIDRL